MKTALVVAAVAAIAALVLAVPAGAGGGLVYAPKDCTTPKKKPHRITLTCGDASTLLRHMKWSSWGGEKAKGQGAIYINDCDPNCADGTFIGYGAKVKLLNIRTSTCAGQTVDLYRRAHVRFIGEVPPHPRQYRSFKLFCDN